MGRQISSVSRLRAALDALADQVAAVSFGLPSTAQPDRRTLRDELEWTIRQYLIPRLADLDRDIVVVVAGSTGSGKSTLLNSLAQRQVSDTGVVRPTTTAPVVWCHEDNAERYYDSFLTGYGQDAEDSRSLDIVTDNSGLLRGVTLIDAPDFDSVVSQHREIASELLAVADLCIFVTSAQRYADAVPWEFLEQAARRRLPLLFVVNRLPGDGKAEIVDDYVRLLRSRDIPIGEPQIVEIEEQQTDPAYLGLPPRAVSGVRERLVRLSDPSIRRAAIVGTTRGTVDDVIRRTDDLVAAIDEENTEGAALIEIAGGAYAGQLEEIAAALRTGSLIRSEVGERWQRFLGTGSLVRALNEAAGRARRWAGTVLGGKQPNVVDEDARREFETLVARRLDLAASRSAAAWELDTAGRSLLADGALWKRSPDTLDRIDEAIQDWTVGLVSMVAEQGEGKRRKAQLSSAGVNAVAVIALLALFSHTGGLTGGELGITAGAAAAQQKLLEQAFGATTLRWLVETARLSLVDHVKVLFDADRARFTDRVKPLLSGSDLGLRHATATAREAAEGFYGG